jgi:hypothetical protein
MDFCPVLTYGTALLPFLFPISRAKALMEFAAT